MKKSIEKVVIAATILCICCVLSSCKSMDYKKGQELMSQGNFQAAYDILSNLDYNDASEKSDECRYNLAKESFDNEDWNNVIYWCEGFNYLDSTDLLTTAHKEKGMSENADYAFLADIAESILRRNETANDGNTSAINIVNVDLAYVEKYYDAEFYDLNLHKLAKQYIDGVRQEKNAITAVYKCEYQLEWTKGCAARFLALREMYNDYGLLEDNATFVGNYIAQTDERVMLANAYEALEADLTSQEVEGDLPWYYENEYMCCSLVNRTEYTYSTLFTLYLYDENDQLVDSRGDLIEKIKPDTAYKVSVYVGDLVHGNSTLHFDWDNYYTDVTFK